MATLPRPQLFCWDSVDQLGDLQRLCLVLDALPDEPLMQTLEAERGNGRNDYPVRPMGNSLIAALVFRKRPAKPVSMKPVAADVEWAGA